MLIALLLAAFVAGSAPQDEAYREALDLFYDGSTHAALDRLASAAAEHPDDPLGPYYQALVLCWLIEQRGGPAPDLEPDFARHLDRAIALAERRLSGDPRDPRARLGRGAARGLRSRLALYRSERRAATRDAVKMRDDLLAVHQLEPASKEAAFGLGLYDYYADVLPRVLKILRFFLSIPGGSRQRGLARIEEARRGPAVHQVEAQAQLYEIYAFYERKPDRALQEIRGLRERFPGSPLWAFRLAEHLRERMGLYAESAEVCREIIRAADEARPNYAPVVGAMARVYLGEALLLDLRLPEARRAVAPVLQGEPQAPWVGPRAQMVAGTSLEIEGDRRGAETYYRAAAGGASRETRVRAHDALESPLRPGEVRGRQLLAEARRLAESGKADQAVATARQVLEAWPDCAEASAWVADADLQEGRLARARPVIERLARAEDADPPWVRPWARLLLAQAHDLAGNRPAALREYKEVWNEPCGRADLRARAAAGLRRPFTRGGDGGRGAGAR